MQPCRTPSFKYHYKILKTWEDDLQIIQRDLVLEGEISVGRANYCIQALISKSLIKANNFKNSQNKTAYMYLLTPRGVTEKLHTTKRFLVAKMAEYEDLQREIEALRNEVGP